MQVMTVISELAGSILTKVVAFLSGLLTRKGLINSLINRNFCHETRFRDVCHFGRLFKLSLIRRFIGIIVVAATTNSISFIIILDECGQNRP